MVPGSAHNGRTLPLRRTALSSLLPAAWRHRHNFTISDAMYVVLADQLGASLLTDDRRLAGSPTLPPGLQLLTLSI